MSEPIRSQVPASTRILHLLEYIAAQLDRGPDRGPVHELVAECDALIVECLEHQTRKTEPSVPSRRELLALTRLLATAGVHEHAVILREIRRALGRLDAVAA